MMPSDLNFMMLYMLVISFSLSLNSFKAINLSRILLAQIYMGIHTPDHNEHTMQGETDFCEHDNPGSNYEKVTYITTYLIMTQSRCSVNRPSLVINVKSGNLR